MSARQTIDNMQFAKSGGQLSGCFSQEDLPRLGGVLVTMGEVQYTLSGSVDSGRPVLRISAHALVSLVCQRCLGEFQQMLDVDRVLPVAKNEAQLALWEKEDPLLDALLADPKMSVADLVEDEILLGLPVVPRHPDGGCEGEVRGGLQ